MPRTLLNLQDPAHLKAVQGQWRFAPGYIPGQPNEGLQSQAVGSPVIRPDYDDTAWEVCPDLTRSLSHGFTSAWYRITVTLPATINGRDIRGAFRPLYLLTLAKALTHYLVHGGFDNTRADPLSGVVALAIVGNEAFFVRDVGVEFVDSFQEFACGGMAIVRHGGVEVHLDGLHDLQGFCRKFLCVEGLR
jgi:hypothetical protein